MKNKNLKHPGIKKELKYIEPDHDLGETHPPETMIDAGKFQIK